MGGGRGGGGVAARAGGGGGGRGGERRGTGDRGSGEVAHGTGVWRQADVESDVARLMYVVMYGFILLSCHYSYCTLRCPI